MQFGTSLVFGRRFRWALPCIQLRRSCSDAAVASLYRRGVAGFAGGSHHLRPSVLVGWMWIISSYGMCFRHVSTCQAPAHDVAFSIDGTCLLALTKVMNSGAWTPAEMEVFMGKIIGTNVRIHHKWRFVAGNIPSVPTYSWGFCSKLWNHGTD